MSTTSLPNRVHLDLRHGGTEIFLGSTESAIMDIYWRNYPCRLTVRTVKRILTGEGNIKAYTTILSTIRRLNKKFLLKKVYGNHYGSIAHEFIATCSREEFIELCIRKTVLSFREHFPEELDRILMETINHS